MTDPHSPVDAGRLLVDCSYNRWFKAIGAMPQITVNGHVTEAHWGQTAFPMPAGAHRVQVAIHGLNRGTYRSPAEHVVTVQPGQVTTVHYRPSALRFGKGALGTAPQRTPGLAAAVTVQAVVAIILIALLILQFTR